MTQAPGGDELARHLAGIEAALATTRREHLAARVGELDALVAATQDLVQRDQAALIQAAGQYRSRFGALARMNPFDRDRSSYHAEHVAPLEARRHSDAALLKRCREVAAGIRAASAPIEWRTHFQAGVAGVYDAVSGQALWRERFNCGVAGVWNPRTGQIEWREKWQCGVAGIWNPVAQRIEWREKWHAGVGGAWNPDRGVVEWREQFQSGVAGIWDPRTRQVQWQTAFQTGVAGAFNVATGQVEWHTRFQCGVACIAFDGTTYVSNGSYFGDCS